MAPRHALAALLAQAHIDGAFLLPARADAGAITGPRLVARNAEATF